MSRSLERESRHLHHCSMVVENVGGRRSNRLGPFRESMYNKNNNERLSAPVGNSQIPFQKKCERSAKSVGLSQTFIKPELQVPLLLEEPSL
jgi:hypothetical protein